MILRQNLLRGKIISFLRDLYPEGIDHSGITSALFEYHRTEDIDESMAYLVDKGYVRRDDKPHPIRPRAVVRLYKITPQGIDLADGLLSDVGIAHVEF